MVLYLSGDAGGQSSLLFFRPIPAAVFIPFGSDTPKLAAALVLEGRPPCLSSVESSGPDSAGSLQMPRALPRGSLTKTFLALIFTALGQEADETH